MAHCLVKLYPYILNATIGDNSPVGSALSDECQMDHHIRALRSDTPGSDIYSRVIKDNKLVR